MTGRHEDKTGTKTVPAAEATLDLGDALPLASGTYRDVYPFPRRGDLVVKVLRPGSEWQPNRPIRNYLKARSVRQLYRFMFREYECYLAAKLRQTVIEKPLPISELYWLQRTSRGLAMVTQRVQGRDGQQARSLGAIHKSGAFDESMLQCLNRWIALVEEYDIVANDTNPDNLLLDEVGKDPRFVLVDGFGDPHPLKLKRLSGLARRRARHRRYARMAGFLGLVWRPEKGCIATGESPQSASVIR